MKLNAEKIQEAAAWVERNGLHPQPCGATLRDFCKAMGINDATYRRWQNNADFADALTRARELFRINTVREVENALVKAARGVDFTRIKEEAKAEVVKEYDPKTGKKVKEYTGELKTIKATRETVYFPPNVEAAKFVLTNLAGDAWKIKQETALTGTILKVVVENTEQRKKIDNIADLG
jgi:hypothetical protein